MADVQFESENELRRMSVVSHGPLGIQGFLIRKGIVANVAQAQALLLVTVALAIGVAVFAILASGNDVSSPKELDQYIQRMNNLRPPR
jgi:hypothetical protein